MNVFCASPWIPVEWIKAHGHEPCGVWALPELGNQPVPVPEGVCPFAQAVLRFAEANPEAVLVFATTCDQMRRGCDAVAASGRPRFFLFNIPATWQTPAARRLYHTEVARLGAWLEALGGQPPKPEQLAAVIRQYDQRRARVREFTASASARATAEMIARLFSCEDNPAPLERERGQPCPPLQSSATGADEAVRAPAAKDGRIPLALVGGPLLSSQWALFDAIESVGGCIVLNATEPGERNLLPPLRAAFLAQVSKPAGSPISKSADRHHLRNAAGRETCDQPRKLSGYTDAEVCATHVGTNSEHDANPALSSEPLATLCDHYFDHCVDVFQRPNSRLYEWLGVRLIERGVRGIVLWVHVGCDLWRAEAAPLRETFGLPVLMLEADETGAGSLRNTNRLAAFLETLRPPGRCMAQNSANWPPLAS